MLVAVGPGGAEAALYNSFTSLQPTDVSGRTAARTALWELMAGSAARAATRDGYPLNQRALQIMPHFSTPVTTTPCINCFCARKKMITGTTADSSDAAWIRFVDWE